MAILSEEAKERIRKRRLAGDFKPKDTFVPTPEDPSSINILGDVAGTMWRGIERAGRLAGLGVGTVAAAPMSLLNLAPIKAVRDWAPDIQDIGESIEAFQNLASEGEWDAAIEAYQDELGGGTGYWGAAELGGHLLVPGAPHLAGAKLLASAPKIASRAARLAPQAARPGIEQATVKGLGATAKVLQAPWKLEDAIVSKPLGMMARTRLGQKGIGALQKGAKAVLPERQLEKAPESLLGKPVTGKLKDMVVYKGVTMNSDELRNIRTDELLERYTRRKKTMEQPEGIDPQLGLGKADIGDYDDPLIGLNDKQIANVTKRINRTIDNEIETGHKEFMRIRRRQSRQAKLSASSTSLDPSNGMVDVGLNVWAKVVNRLDDLRVSAFRKVRKENVEPESTKGKSVIGKDIRKAKRIRDMTRQITENHASLIAILIRKHRDVFQYAVDDKKKLYIIDEALTGNNTGIRVQNPGGGPSLLLENPTVADIAARLDSYKPYLTRDQMSFMNELRDILETGKRFTVKGADGADEVYDLPGFNAVFREGIGGWDLRRVRPDIEAGGFYVPRGEVKTGQQTFSLIEELEQLARSRKSQGPRGKTTAEQAISRPAQGRVIDVGTTVEEGFRKIDDASYKSLDEALTDYVREVGLRSGDIRLQEDILGLAQIHAGKRLIPEKVVRKIGAGQTARAQAAGVEKLDDMMVTDAFADAIRQEFRALPGKSWLDKPFIGGVNKLYRAIKSTYDLSAIGIHGSLAIFRTPTNWAPAAKLSFKALTSKDPVNVADQMIIKFNEGARAQQMLTSDIWASQGLRIGGTDIEVAVPGAARLMESQRKVLRYPAAGLQRSNIAFGAFGDGLRLNWAQDMLRRELGQGRTIKQLMDSGELRDIAQIANKMTGWSEGRFAGDIGEMLFFAPRFLQARLETLGLAFSGLVKTSAPGRGLLGTQARSIQEREAMSAIVRLVGWGAMATELLNLASDHETDRRPIVNGRINPNFYTIRFGGQDFSLFGPQVGLLTAMANTASGRPDKALRGLGSGWSRLLWDNITGYTPVGEKSPLGLLRGYETGEYITNPEDILEYISELAMPIAPQQVGGQIIGAAQEIPDTLRGDPEARQRLIGGIASVPTEFAGGRVSPISRGDLKDEIATDLYGERYDSQKITNTQRALIDKQVDEQMGEGEYRGRTGPLYKKKDEYTDDFMTKLQRLETKRLSGAIWSPEFHPESARHTYNQTKKEYFHKLHGYWNERLQRYEGGLYEQLYERNKVREEPDPNTPEHDMWRYYDIFRQATDKEGTIDWDAVNELEARFWGSMPPDRTEMLLDNIRVLEGEYPAKVQQMVDAGRYAGSLRQTIDGFTGTYYDMEDHPRVIAFLVQESGQTEATVRAYLNTPYWERKAVAKDPIEGSIQDALEDASRQKKGILWYLKDTFIKNAPLEWIYAMYNAGFKYQGYSKINERIEDHYKEQGQNTPPSIDFEGLYRTQVKGR
jgi:hypothetical protein